jgi:hypothetical protein
MAETVGAIFFGVIYAIFVIFAWFIVAEPLKEIFRPLTRFADPSSLKFVILLLLTGLGIFLYILIDPQ